MQTKQKKNEIVKILRPSRIIYLKDLCRSGGIGRRAGLRIQFPRGSGGSSPLSCTIHSKESKWHRMKQPLPLRKSYIKSRSAFRYLSRSDLNSSAVVLIFVMQS